MIIKEIVALITLLGIIVNLIISYRAFKAARHLEDFKGALSFREKSLELLSQAKESISKNMDLSAFIGVITGKKGDALKDSIKQFREEYMNYYNLYSRIRYLFFQRDRISIDKQREFADKLDAGCFSCLFDSQHSDSLDSIEFGTLFSDFCKAANAFRDSLREAIDSTMTRYADDLRDKGSL